MKTIVAISAFSPREKVAEGRMRGSLVAALALLAAIISAPVQAANPTGIRTFLIPINVPNPTPGLKGTVWQSELWVHNGETFPIRIRGCGGIEDGTPCLPRHAPGVTELAFGGEVTTFSYSGPMLYQLPVVGKFNLSSRLFELSRHAQPAGIHLPIVPEERFFHSPARFLALPGGTGRRIAVRLYDPRRKTGSSLRVDLVSEDGALLDSVVVPLSYSIVPDEPGFAAIYDLGAEFPRATTGRFDLVVSPMQDGMEFWALVSVTDDDTQQVLLVTAD